MRRCQASTPTRSSGTRSSGSVQQQQCRCAARLSCRRRAASAAACETTLLHSCCCDSAATNSLLAKGLRLHFSLVRWCLVDQLDSCKQASIAANHRVASASTTPSHPRSRRC